MHAGLGFRDGAVVELDLGGLALDEDALSRLAVSGDADAAGDRGRVGARAGADGERDIGLGVAGVGQIDGDKPITCRGGGGKDARDAQVG